MKNLLIGAAHDAWLSGIADGAEPAKLAERVAECSTSGSRGSYYVD